MTKDKSDFLYASFSGPNADNGEINIAKAGQILLALNRWQRHYKKDYKQNKVNFNLKLRAVKKNCTELQIVLDILDKAKPVIDVGTVAAFTNLPGVKDFLKEIGKTLGAQLMLKVFAKNKHLRESEPYLQNNKIVVKVTNFNNETRIVPKDQIDFYRKTSRILDDMYVLEPNKEDRLKVGYFTSDSGYEVTGEVFVSDREAFSNPYLDSIEERMEEGFDDSKAFECKVIGQFVDSYSLAHKYKFAFQARKQQEDYGKQKILCIVEPEMISEIYELMKPENKGNVCIKGKAMRDKEGRLDKIKIEWINRDENYNPNQTELL